MRGIDFDVSEGEVFGLLGPNGAGKTATVQIWKALRPRTQGGVKVLGFDQDFKGERVNRADIFEQK